jgi:hypothetical protein
MIEPVFIVSYIADSSVPMSVWEYAAELENNGKLGAEVPKATAQHWKREIEQAIAKGLLVEGTDGNIRAPALDAGIPKQLTLF